MKVKIKKAIYGFSVAMLLMLNVFTFSTINFANEDDDGSTDGECTYIKGSVRDFIDEENGICWIIADYDCPWFKETRQIAEC